MCNREDPLAHILGAPHIDNVLSYNSLKTHQHDLIFRASSECRAWVTVASFTMFMTKKIWGVYGKLTVGHVLFYISEINNVIVNELIYDHEETYVQYLLVHSDCTRLVLLAKDLVSVTINRK